MKFHIPQEEIRNETILMSQMKHPNVVPYYGSFVNDRVRAQTQSRVVHFLHILFWRSNLGPASLLPDASCARACSTCGCSCLTSGAARAPTS